MEWVDTGYIVSVKSHGETSAVVGVLTETHGRHMGYVKGARSKKFRGVLDLGNEVEARWLSRVEDGLGSFVLEGIKNHASLIMAESKKLQAIQSICSLTDSCLPERENHPAVYEGMKVFLEGLDGLVWPETYILWEIALLRELGFGLDLKECAGGGDNDQLAYVSPKSGRAVSLSAGEPYKEKLLKLPAFLLGEVDDNQASIVDGLKLTEYFLRSRVFDVMNKDLPEPRRRFFDLMNEVETLSGTS